MTPERVRVGILISGRGSNMAALIEAAAASDYPASIALVLSNRAAAPGLDIARAAGIPARSVALSAHGGDPAAFDAAIDAALRAHGVELVCLAGYMRLLTPAFLAGWQDRVLNIHPSLLPAYKGLDTHARAIAAGDAVAGCSVHVVTPELDAGPVLARAEVAILPGDTGDSLAARVLAEEHKLYPKAVRAYATTLRRRGGTTEPTADRS